MAKAAAVVLSLMTRSEKVLHSITLVAASAALVVSILALATPGPAGRQGPQGNPGRVGAAGAPGTPGPPGPRGKVAGTHVLEEQIATLERKVDLIQKVQGTEGLESPSAPTEVPTYSGGGDLDCSDFSETDFPTPPGDPDGLDGDGDGIACES
jgi:hypothetical protein